MLGSLASHHTHLLVSLLLSVPFSAVVVAVAVVFVAAVVAVVAVVVAVVAVIFVVLLSVDVARTSVLCEVGRHVARRYTNGRNRLQKSQIFIVLCTSVYTPNVT